MIALDWGPRLTPDLALTEGGALARDDGLRTAVLLSLFCDARAAPDDPVPDPLNPDRRGWIGDVLAPVDGDRWGSRLWLLAREKQTEATRRRAELYAREALAWLVEDGLAARVEVEAAWAAPQRLGLRIRIAALLDETFTVSL